MSYRFPTVDEFKAQFSRDFPFAVPAWGAKASLTVVAGVITAGAVTAGGQGYANAPTLTISDPTKTTGTAAVLSATIANGKVTGITVTNGGSGYVAPVLEISGGAGDETDLSRVTDADIEGASIDAQFNVNQDLFEDQATFIRAFCYLQAHCLCEKIAAATQGLASQYAWLTTAKSVDKISESFQIPPIVAESAFLSAFSKTRYGALYLQIITPLLIGNMRTDFRQSLP